MCQQCYEIAVEVAMRSSKFQDSFQYVKNLELRQKLLAEIFAVEYDLFVELGIKTTVVSKEEYVKTLLEMYIAVYDNQDYKKASEVMERIRSSEMPDDFHFEWPEIIDEEGTTH